MKKLRDGTIVTADGQNGDLGPSVQPSVTEHEFEPGRCG